MEQLIGGISYDTTHDLISNGGVEAFTNHLNDRVRTLILTMRANARESLKYCTGKERKRAKEIITRCERELGFRR